MLLNKKIMVKRLCIIALALMGYVCLYAQNPVMVMESSFKVKANDTVSYFFSFAAGDQIVLDFSENNGLTLKQVEVIELPNVVKYNEHRVGDIENKVIAVPKTAVYEFRFSNPTLVGHACDVRIQRIPKNRSTQDFNTSWKWRTMYDTTYVYQTEDSIVGYDSIPYVEVQRELVSDELSEQMLADNVVEVKAVGIVKKDNPRDYVKFALPVNREDENKTTEVVAWAYWVAVGKNAASVWSKNKSLTKSAVKQVAKWVGVASPLAALALGVGVDLLIPDENKVDNVQYALMSSANDCNAFLKGGEYKAYQKGFGTGGYGRIDKANMLQGTHYIGLYNDNYHTSIRVNVKVSAIVETKTYQDVRYERIRVKPRYVPVNRTKMQVRSWQERVPEGY